MNKLNDLNFLNDFVLQDSKIKKVPETWPVNFFDFEPVEETPDFSLYRDEGKESETLSYD